MEANDLGKILDEVSDSSEGVEFMAPVRPDELSRFLTRIGEWADAHSVQNLSLSWNGISARVKVGLGSR